jgi:hypothetical protein
MILGLVEAYKTKRDTDDKTSNCYRAVDVALG